MSFRTVSLLTFCLSLSLPAVAAAPHPDAELEIGVVGDLEIGPDGAVRTFEVTSKLAEPLENLVERKVRDWDFEPVAVDGKPVIAKTRARLTLRAIPTDGDYQLRLEDVAFGEATPAAGLKPPRYPVDMVREGVGARVMLVAKLDADGRVVEVHPYQTSLDKPVKSDFTARKWRERFETISVAAVSQWRYDLSETAGGIALAENVVMIPIQFALTYGNGNPSLAWRQYIPGPITPAPWQDDTRVAQLDAIGENETRSLTSRFRLKNDVTGTTL